MRFRAQKVYQSNLKTSVYPHGRGLMISSSEKEGRAGLRLLNLLDGRDHPRLQSVGGLGLHVGAHDADAGPCVARVASRRR